MPASQGGGVFASLVQTDRFMILHPSVCMYMRQIYCPSWAAAASKHYFAYLPIDYRSNDLRRMTTARLSLLTNTRIHEHQRQVSIGIIGP